MERKNTDTESSCTKTKLLTETLKENILTAASRDTQFDYQDQS